MARLLLHLQAFLYKTVPQFCSTGPAPGSYSKKLAGDVPNFNTPLNTNNVCSDGSCAVDIAGTCTSDHNGATSATAAPSSSSSSSDEAAWPIAWQLVCGRLTNSSATASGQAGMTVFPAVFKPLVRAAEACASPANSSSRGGLQGWLRAAVQRVGCRISWAALLVATRLLRAALFVAQLSHFHCCGARPCDGHQRSC
jgi:hypothetical protein